MDHGGQLADSALDVFEAVFEVREENVDLAQVKCTLLLRNQVDLAWGAVLFIANALELFGRPPISLHVTYGHHEHVVGDFALANKVLVVHDADRVILIALSLAIFVSVLLRKLFELLLEVREEFVHAAAQAHEEVVSELVRLKLYIILVDEAVDFHFTL